MKTLSIIGFGTFGQFITPYFKKTQFEIYAWNRSDQQEAAQKLGVHWVGLDEALSKEIIVLATNISFFEQFLIDNSAKINPNALVLDVASVKMKPVELMQKYLPETCEIVGTHPLFGPQSGKNGIEGLNCVLCPVRTTKEKCIYDFLSNELKLNVLLRTPEEHDRQMAYVQGLTHFISRAVSAMGIADSDQKTRAYERLLDIKNFLGGDSFELFRSIENDNPFAKEVRHDFIKELLALEEILEKTK